MGNFKKLMQCGALDSKLRGTCEPSTEGQSQCDPGLEREVYRDQEAHEIGMAFWYQGLGEDWRSLPLSSSPAWRVEAAR